MNSLFLAILAFVGYIIAYNTYGRWIGNKIFKLNNKNVMPSHKYEDGVDYVPTKRHIILGHHFTTIAGTGPIVGPAIGVIWGWVPAFIWVFFGSIFMGAVHDFSALVISARHEGKTIGELTRGLISNRTAVVFLILIQFLLWIVIAIFAMIMGILFNMYPASVFPVWMEIPIALLLSYMIYKKGKSDVVWSIIAIIAMYVTIWIGLYLPITVPPIAGSSVITWSLILFVYVFIASTLPVHWLLQPRDYINSHELLIAMGLLTAGVFVAHPTIVAPAFNSVPDAPPILPMLFITIACGAISGFHSLAASGTTVKQVDKETDTLAVGYGGMILEGVLATLVIIAVTAGLGMSGGAQVFTERYASWASASGLGAKLAAVVDGSANLMASLGIPRDLAASIMAVFIVSFAGTTLDSATRIQRFSLQELLKNRKGKTIKPFDNRYVATFVVVFAAAVLAFLKPGGKGALILWPLFGALNQLLAGLVLMIATVYLAKKKRPFYVTLIPMVFMLTMTIWATFYNLNKFIATQNWLLIFISVVTLLITAWMIYESAKAIANSKSQKPLVEELED